MQRAQNRSQEKIKIDRQVTHHWILYLETRTKTGTIRSSHNETLGKVVAKGVEVYP